MTKKYDGPPPEGCNDKGEDTGFHLGMGVGQDWWLAMEEEVYQATLARTGFDKMGNKVAPAQPDVSAEPLMAAAPPTLSKAIADLERLL